jgi:hypothetical protein
MSHDPVTGLLVTEEGRDDCDDVPGDATHVRARSTEQDGVYKWNIVELDDPGHDARLLAHDVSGDKPPVDGSWIQAIVAASTPPSTCNRQVEYRIQVPEGGCAVIRAVPCSPEQRDRLEVFAHRFMFGDRIPPLDSQSLKQSRGLVPADMDFLVLGLPAAKVLDELGLPYGFLPRYPDGFSLEYRASEYLGGDFVIVDFAKDRNIAGVRTVRNGG